VKDGYESLFDGKTSKNQADYIAWSPAALDRWNDLHSMADSLVDHVSLVSKLWIYKMDSLFPAIFYGTPFLPTTMDHLQFTGLFMGLCPYFDINYDMEGFAKKNQPLHDMGWVIHWNIQ
jgi:hypothetical protein